MAWYRKYMPKRKAMNLATTSFTANRKEKTIMLDNETLQQLAKYLDNNNAIENCDSISLRHTIEFLKENGIPVQPAIKWLNEKGAYCDCEVMYNVILG